jgi:hypothetical protein
MVLIAAKLKARKKGRFFFFLLSSNKFSLNVHYRPGIFYTYEYDGKCLCTSAQGTSIKWRKQAENS